MNTIGNCNSAHDWHDMKTELRDFATSLTGDPLEGDLVMRRVLRQSRRDAKGRIDLYGMRDWLMGDIEALCLQRSGCPLSADPEYVDPSDVDEQDDQSDDDSDRDDQDTEVDWHVERYLLHIGEAVPPVACDGTSPVPDAQALPLLDLVVAA
jgi:hypothetical protein